MAREKAKTAMHLLKMSKKLLKGNKGSVIRDMALLNMDMILLYFLNLGMY